MKGKSRMIQNSPMILRTLLAATTETVRYDAVLRLGCIRLGTNNEYGQPYYHVNETHTRVGLDGYGSTDMKVERDVDDNLLIDGLSSGGEEEAGVLLPFPDETMASKGVFIGASGLALSNEIRMYRRTTSGSIVHVGASEPMWDSNTANVWYLSIALKLATGLGESLGLPAILERLDALEAAISP